MNVLFHNVRIFDGSGESPFAGEVLVSGQRIVEIAREGQSIAVGAGNARRVNGRGCTLMPGLTEAHAHLSWPSSVERFVPGMQLPLDDLALTAARNARILLDHGFTSAYSGGSLGRTLEVFLKSHIDSGGMPGPRLIASTIEREPTSADHPVSPGMVDPHGRGPEAIRAFIRDCAAIGAQAVKLLLTGESALEPGASMRVQYTAGEVEAAGQQARESGVWLTGHAHASAAIQLGLLNGFRILYHCTYADEATLDLIEAHKSDIFIAPSVGIAQATLDAKPPPNFDMTHMKQDAEQVIRCQSQVMPELKKRGVRLLPGGDYGFPFNPNGRNARDLQLFVRLFGFTPTEALVAATRYGGELMGQPDELGCIRAGYLADLLLVDGDPTQDVAILQQRDRLVAIMKDGRFHKEPAGVQYFE